MEYLDRPLIANLITTRNCNMDCIFCGVEHMSRRRGPDVSIDQAKEVIRHLKESGILRVNFFGGEPLFYPDIEELVRFTKAEGMYCSMVTNGRLLTEGNIDWVTKYVDAIAVSLHGMSENNDRIVRRRNSFNDTVAKLKKLRDSTDRITVNMTVTDNDVEDIAPMVRYLHQACGIEAFALNRCIGSVPEGLPNEYSAGDVSLSLEGINRSLRIVDEVSKELPVRIRYAIHFPYCLVEDQKYLKYVGSCGVGANYISVALDGSVQMCSYTSGVLGNIRDSSLLDIWRNHGEYRRYRQGAWLPEKCVGCGYLDTCMVGCKMSSGLPTFSADSLLSSMRGRK